MWDRIVGKANPLSERRPQDVVGEGEKLHCTISITPPTFDFTITLRVVATGGGLRSADGCENVREKL